MVSSTSLIVGGLIGVFIGIIMLIIGISIYESNVKTNTSQSWYVWFLIVGGIFIGLVGVAICVYGLTNRPETPIILIQP